MRRFSIYKRTSIFYVRFWNNETKAYSSGISTGETVKELAALKIARWQADGIPEKETVNNILSFDSLLFYLRETPLDTKQTERILAILKDRNLLENQAGHNETAETPLLDFLNNFWDYEKSEYVKEKLAYGHSLGRRHCYDMQKRLKHWLAFFGDKKKIKDISKDDIQKFQFHLKKSLAFKTVNLTISTGGVAFKWLLEKGYINENPTDGIRKFSGITKKRGILTPGQVKKLFSVLWEDDRCRVGSLVSMTCGLRIGEVLALKFEDIGTDRLFVRHSWSFADGLKCPKNKESRTVPLMPAVRKELLNLLESSPWGKDGFIFYGADYKNKPMGQEAMTSGFCKALEKIGISREERLEKNIVFHSWRHFFAANLANKTELRTVQIATGHKTGAMAEHYANHESEEKFNELTDALNSVFWNLVPFVKEA